MADDGRLLRIKQGNSNHHPPIHSAVPTIATTQDTLFMVLEVFHAVLGLANSFSSTFLAAESQD